MAPILDPRAAAETAGALAGCRVRWHGGVAAPLECARPVLAFLAAALFALECARGEIVEVAVAQRGTVLHYRLWSAARNPSDIDVAATALAHSAVFASFGAHADSSTLVLTVRC